MNGIVIRHKAPRLGKLFVVVHVSRLFIVCILVLFTIQAVVLSMYPFYLFIQVVVVFIRVLCPSYIYPVKVLFSR